MSEKPQKATSCGCAQSGSDQSCPCKKRICLPILGIVVIAIAISMASRKRSRK